MTDRDRTPWEPDPSAPVLDLEAFRRGPRREYPALDPVPTRRPMGQEEWTRLYANLAAAYHTRIADIERDLDESHAAALLAAAESRRTREFVEGFGAHLVEVAKKAATDVATTIATDGAVKAKAAAEKAVEDTGSHIVAEVLDHRELEAHRKRRDRLLDLLKVVVGGAGAVGIEQLVKFLALGHF